MATNTWIKTYREAYQSIAPLVTFRILFGLIMTLGVIRFMAKGWIEQLYLTPKLFFPYYGFTWIKPLDSTGMYLIFILMLLSAMGICLGLFYRLSAVIFFLTFTYVELLDKTNYLNHYYFVSLVAFYLIFLPTHKNYSLDVYLSRSDRVNLVPRWNIDLVKIQLGIVYFFAGVAKLNGDWILHALPLKIWLPALSHLPIIGFILEWEVTAYGLSWLGALFDILIFFLLLQNRIRPFAYLILLTFHLFTGFLFPIGIFPWVMMGATLIFFSPQWHQNLLLKLFPLKSKVFSSRSKNNQSIIVLFSVIIFIQLLVPIRAFLYPGNLFWTEQGYRFSWRVMLMEKAGHTTFLVVDQEADKKEWVINDDYLTTQQIKMMSTQPDMILQFAHYIRDIYIEKGFNNPQIYCQSKVSLNGRPSKTFIDPNIDLAQIPLNLAHRYWISEYE